MSKRDISLLLQIMRNFLLGRKHTPALRFEQDVASRSPPLPNLPEGPHHILSANYYYARDGRREAKPPLVLADGGSVLKIGTGEEGKKSAITRTPGQPYSWD